MNKYIFYLLFVTAAAISCSGNKNKVVALSKEKNDEPKDSMIYGLSCDGTNDSVIVFLPFGDSQPLRTFNIEFAKFNHNIIGQPEIGDWVGIMVNPKDRNEATMVVDLDQLKGTWTYSVIPTWKEPSRLSPRAIRRKLDQIPDSMRQYYLIPREYGFTLSRSSVAEPVGRMMTSSSIDNDSPVEYPPVPNVTEWHCRNGHLILTYDNSMHMPENSHAKSRKLVYDTLDFVSLTDDSLIIRRHDNTYIHYSRKENAQAANAEAMKASLKVK